MKPESICSVALPSIEMSEKSRREAPLKLMKLPLEGFVHNMDIVGWHHEYSPSLISMAVKLNRHKHLRACFEHGITMDSCLPGENPIHLAAKDGKVNILRAFVENGVPLDAHAVLLEKIRNGEWYIPTRCMGVNTPLHWAAQACSMSAARLLLRHGASPNQQDEAGDTPLLRMLGAKDQGSKGVDMLHLLLKHGASLETRGSRIKTAMELVQSKDFHSPHLAAALERHMLELAPPVTRTMRRRSRL